MKASRPVTTVRGVAVFLSLFVVAGFVSRAGAQQEVSLVTFTNTWRYDQSGTDLGTDWRTASFNDASWPSGLPLFGIETTVPFPYIAAGFNSINTPLSLFGPGQGAQTLTYYFRTHFNLPTTNLSGTVLMAAAYVDDGCVLHLNGAEAGRARVPAGQNWQTPATTIVMEGTPDLFTLPTSSLRAGDNVLAVEVHQSGPGNGDIAFALNLIAALPQPLVITNQPRSQTNIAGTLATFKVGVSGGPVAFQWRKNGLRLPNATNATYNPPFPLQMSSAGVYSVVVSNALGSAISDDVVLTVVPDDRARLLSAYAVEEATRTNRIDIVFDEALLPASVSSPGILTNGTLRVVLVESNITVAISNAVYNPGTYPQPGTPPRLALLLDPTHWHFGSNYTVFVNHVRDTAGNVIAPDSQVGVAWPRHLALVGTNALWDFHAAAVFEPKVFAQGWTQPGYVPGPWWAQGLAPFCAGPVLTAPCLGAPLTEIGFQPEPTLFRIPFFWPADLPDSATLQISYSVDDAAIFYLNGAELLRKNLDTNVAMVLPQTRTATDVGSPDCVTAIFPTTALVPGTNWLAVAVVSTSVGLESTVIFGCAVQSTYFDATTRPDIPPPSLLIQPAGNDAVTLSWSGAGFALEYVTNLSPTGVWREVTNMSNPFLQHLEAPQRFFRLRK